MSKMVETKDGSFVLRSEIISIREHGKKGEECEIMTKHGKTYIVQQRAQELAAESEFDEEAIPAEPGYFALFSFDESRRLKDFRKVPVVGWTKFKPRWQKVNSEASFSSIPIVPGGYASRALGTEHEQLGLVLPDGRVIDTRTLREYESVKTFVKKRETMFKI